MKILLDNCVTRPFESHLSGHEVIHCSRLGWEKLPNGKLMSAAENAGFDVLINVDQGIQYQQNLVDRKIFVIYIRAANTDMPTLIPMVKIVLARIVDAKLGTLLTVLPLGSL